MLRRLPHFQPTLIPVPLVSVALVWHYDGPQGAITYGWTITDSESGECLNAEANLKAPFRAGLGQIDVTTQMLHQRAQTYLAPF